MQDQKTDSNEDREASEGASKSDDQDNTSQGSDVRGMQDEDLRRYLRLMWAGSATPEDRERWHQQGFSFSGQPSFGLQQGHGGPCGVLAAVQAEIMRYLIFGPEEEGDPEGEGREGSGQLPGDLGAELLQDALVQALLTIFARVKGPGGIYSVVTARSLPLDIFASASDFFIKSFSDTDSLRSYLVAQMDQFQSISGTILFVISILLTRGLDQVEDDMDGPDCTLTGHFGHCSQELLNLLLCGQASSNVFDGEIPMGDTGLTLKGVPKRSTIGYLTHLEALRYCQVGSYYKSPIDPVWVVGSSSHFTVMFGVDNTPVTESAGEKLLEKVQRAFKEVDSQGDGYIPVQELGTVLRKLELRAGNDQNQLSALAAKLEVTGANIILWEEFWKVTSLLMTGGTIEQVLTGDAKKPDVIREVPEADQERRDSEIARELQRQLDGEMMDVTPSALPGLDGGSGTGNRPRSDSDIARELQQQFDQEQGGSGTTSDPLSVLANATSDSAQAVPNLAPVDSTPTSNPDGDASTPNTARGGIHRHDSVADESGPSFILYHYNGQQSGGRQSTLTRFGVIKRSDENTVGESIPMSAGTSESTYACPIEEVLHTKWPGCRVDWFSQNPPSID